MWNNQEFLVRIWRTNLFNEKIKNDLIKYIDILNEKQKLSLFHGLKSESMVLLDFLKSLKKEKIYSFQEIKFEIEKIHRKNRKVMELDEEKNNGNELNNLLDTLGTI